MYIGFHAGCQFFIPLIILIFFYSSIFLAVSKNISHKNDSIKLERDSSCRYGDNTLTIKDNQVVKNNNVGNNNADGNSLMGDLETRRRRGCFFRIFSRKTEPNFSESGSSRSHSSKTKHKIHFTSKRREHSSSSSQDQNKAIEILPLKPIENRVNVNNAAFDQNKILFKTNNSSSFQLKQRVPIRQNRPSKFLSKSKMKTLKLTITVVIAYVLCTLPFYVGVFVYFFIDPSYKNPKNIFHKIISKHHILYLKFVFF